MPFDRTCQTIEYLTGAGAHTNRFDHHVFEFASGIKHQPGRYNSNNLGS